MACPAILLREFHQPSSNSDWVPGKLVQTYKQLESLSFGILSRDPNEWTVHFHLEDGACEGKALPLLWNNAAYFDESCLNSGKLHLYAHFERVAPARAAPKMHSSVPQPRTSSTAPSTRTNTESTAQYPSPLVTTDEVGLPLSSQGRTSFNKSLPLPMQQKRKRAIVQDVSSDSDPDDFLERFIRPSLSDSSGDEDDTVRRGRNRPIYTLPSLPAIATPDRHAVDLENAILFNASPSEYGYKPNWKNMNKAYKAKVAHARLINGIYGAPARTACDRCKLENVACRVYHPELNITPAGTTGACSNCRLTCSTCSTNGVSLRDRITSPIGSAKGTERPAKTSRLTRTEPPSQLESSQTVPKHTFYCPIETCERHWRPIRRKENFTRHMTTKHEPSLSHVADAQSAPKESRRTSVSAPKTTTEGGFQCPVPGCFKEGGYRRMDNFRTFADHINAIRDKTFITLPPPPADEYAADFQEAYDNNAPEGTFGHRHPSQWTENVRTRVAHAKLINGKYGVLAVQSCDNCKKRGTTCMVYPPGLKAAVGPARSLGWYCGECRSRSSKCEINLQMWERVLGPTTVGEVALSSYDDEEEREIHIRRAESDIGIDEEREIHITRAESDADDEDPEGESGTLPVYHDHPLSQAIQAGEEENIGQDSPVPLNSHSAQGSVDFHGNEEETATPGDGDDHEDTSSDGMFSKFPKYAAEPFTFKTEEVENDAMVGDVEETEGLNVRWENGRYYSSKSASN